MQLVWATTHNAGIAVAFKDNGRGVAGVAPEAELVVAKAFDGEGNAIQEDVSAAIKWVVNQGAQVVNLSAGANLLGPASLREPIAYAWSHGAVPVLGSGNTSSQSQSYGDLDALVVGATGPDDQMAPYSSPTGNAKWSLVAPGGLDDGNNAHRILSTFWVKGKQNQYAYGSGTSAAAPHVAGAVALLLAMGYRQQAAVDRILETADASVSCGSNSPTCSGRLDVARAAGAASQ